MFLKLTFCIFDNFTIITPYYFILFPTINLYPTFTFLMEALVGWMVTAL